MGFFSCILPPSQLALSLNSFAVIRATEGGRNDIDPLSGGEETLCGWGEGKETVEEWKCEYRKKVRK